jgi:TPR repeat protein
MFIEFDQFKDADMANHYLARLNQDFENGIGGAGFLLYMIYSQDNAFLSNEMKIAIGCSDQRAGFYGVKSFDLLQKEAECAKGSSMHLIAKYYELGIPPATRDFDSFKVWTDRAAENGFPVVEDLLLIYGDPKSKYYNEDKARQIRELI